MTDCALRGSSSGMCEEGATSRACVCERGGGGRRRPCLRVARCAATPTRTRALPPPREAISVKRPIHAPPWPLLMQTTRRRAACSRRPASRSCSGRLRRTRCSPRARSRSSTCARPGSLRASGCRVRPMCRRASPALRGCSSTFGRCARPARSHEPRRPARRAHARALIRASVRAWQGFVEELRASHPPEAAPLLLMCELGVVSLVAANKLLDHGYAEVSVVRGGLEAWRDEPLPTEADKALPEAEQEEDYDTDEWWRSAVGPFPEWTAAEALPMWPVAGADAEPPEAELDADELGLLGLDELELDEFGELTDGAEEAPAPFGTGFAEKLFAEEPPPPSPLEAADRAAAGLDELVADLDKAIPAGSDGKPPKKGKKAKAGAPKTSLAAVAAASAAAAPPPDAPAARRPSAAASYGGPSRQPRGQGNKGRFRGGLPPAWLVDVSDVDFAGLAAKDELSKLSVKELKSFLYECEASLSGAKKILVDRVTGVLTETGQLSGDGAAPAPAAPPAPAPPVNGAAKAPVNGAAAGGAAAAEGGEGEEERLSLFHTEGGADPQDDFLIDEVFSAM
eukprot:Transcript_4070.p1 GENE.Transcript_4070~~Transcript_4070.p1  ORF type:complete len:568 (-),score=145.19 Transcript_4070:1500-3203(-)